jgi:hypothetical protein
MTRAVTLVLTLLTCPALATEPTIENITATQTAPGLWRFDVTLSHPDTGWDHYADGWRVLDMAGNALGMRVLHHPHVTEQPFTRSLSDVPIPSGTTEVQIQARDHPKGWSTTTKTITLE